MKHKRLLTSLIVGMALLLGLLITLNLTTTAAIAAPPPPIVDAHANGFDDMPPGLAPALARALADDLPDSYHVQAQADASGYQADNAAHNLATTFDAAGPLIEIAGETWGLALTGWGRAGEIAPVPAGAPVAAGPRLEYRRGPLTEWYLNTPWGLEQGFTLHASPLLLAGGGIAGGGRRGEGELVLELTTRGSLRATLACGEHSRTDGATRLLLTDAEGQTVARYTGLHVYDAAGRDLPARLTLRHGQLTIHVDDADAVYPITVDPWIQSAKLTANDGEAYDYFGQAVAIEGDTVVVGAPSGGMFATPGAVYIFRKQGTSWNSMSQIIKLTANDGAPGDNLGGAVAIDGGTVVAGAYGDDGYRGAVYVFVEPKNGWGWYDPTRTAKLTAAGGTADDYLGGAVAIDGDTIVAGAYGDDDYRGAVYLFAKPADGWHDITHTARLTVANGTADDHLGTSVAIDGDTIVVGAKGDDGYRGAAYVFSRPSGGWRDSTPTAKLTATDGAAYDYLGQSVAIDGDTIVVGAYGDDIGGNDNQGAAYVFVEPAAGWQDTTHTAKLKAADGAAWDNLGRSVAIEGDAVVAGAYGDDVGGSSDVGAAYVFVKPTGGWQDITPTLKLTTTDGAAWDNLGRAVAIDDLTIVAGASGDSSNRGAAYIFAHPLLLSKSVMPAIEVPNQSTLTYTVLLQNTGPVDEPGILVTDTFATQSVAFARWVVSPTGTLRAGGTITWNGTAPAGSTLTWKWVVTHTGRYGDVVTNTAGFSGPLQAGADDATFIVVESPVLYVDADATGGMHDGLNWTTAYTNVQDALDHAHAHSTHDYEIWVAEGVYYPNEGAGHTADSESESFTLRYDNVQLYGGFAATETQRAQRDWQAHVTILSGDYDHRVFWLDGVTYEPITETTVIDGFTLLYGQAIGDDPHERGGGLYCDGSGSGHKCNPTLRHVIFDGNQVENRGGGMYNDGRDGGESSPTLVNVIFRGNHASSEDGGGMYNDGRDGESSPTLINVLFEGNRAQEGGGIYNTGRDGGVSSPMLTNVTISGNEAHEDDGGGMYNDGRGGASSPTLVNVIIWGNEAVDAGQQLYNEYATPVFSYTLIQTGTDHIHNDEGSSASYVHVLTADPQFVAPTAGNYRLQAGSPAIDAGDNTAPGLGGVTTDLDGHTRFADTPRADTGHGEAPIVDMGAYERLPPVRMHKTAWPTQDVGRHDTVTYTLTLANAGTHSDTIRLTDTLPISTSFVTWVVSPTGTALALAPTNDEITWSGALSVGHALTWTWRVTHTGDYGDVIANTATFSSTYQTDRATAEFQVISTYVITPTAGAGGSISPDTPQTVVQGDDVTFDIAPTTGYHIADVRVDGESAGAVETHTFRQVAADHTISAMFALDEHTLTVGVEGEGTVTRIPDQTTYLYGEVVTLTAEPATDYQFDGWSGDDLADAANPAQIVMDADKVVTATFVPVPIKNTAPTISAIDDQETAIGTPTGPISFTIGDAETNPAVLTLTGASSDPNLIPVSNLVFSGSGANRAVTVTPADGVWGIASLTITVSDSELTDSESFVLTVTPYQVYLPLVWRE